MAYLIDKTYFEKGQTAINNSQSTEWACKAVGDSVSDFIARYEPEYLTKLLGATLYAYVVEHPTEPRIVILIAKLRNSTDKISPIANYVYYVYQQQNTVIQTEAGDKESSLSGLSPMANNAKYCAVWKWMVDQSESIYDWLIENSDTYPEFEQTSDDDLDSSDIFSYINILGI